MINFDLYLKQQKSETEYLKTVADKLSKLSIDFKAENDRLSEEEMDRMEKYYKGGKEWLYMKN